MVSTIGQQALMGITIHLLCFALTWWALQALNFDKMLRSNRVLQARVLYILLTIAIGSAVAGFLLNYLFWSNQLPYFMD
ncbi:putative integral membrane protein (TIGR02327 family) [Peribacillus deserti]|uniref:Integral membrane protein (TIGR02327 family) n=1 Tax=Peribacillus deserti TaxID=673318 RepID=A0ABS2QEH1_9BACI|nr:DUF1146 family protein [Peribacillus deserti]MBM7690701.1 putative integral membrane protein (TIGR02327 family) [Peribacillus deserti]